MRTVENLTKQRNFEQCTCPTEITVPIINVPVGVFVRELYLEQWDLSSKWLTEPPQTKVLNKKRKEQMAKTFSLPNTMTKRGVLA